jgi:hypothetical protein
MLDHLWFAVWLEDGTHVHGTTPRPDGIDWRAGYVQAPGAAPIEVQRLDVRADEPDDEGLFGAVEVQVDDLGLVLEPAAFAPVPLRGAGASYARFPRAMVRVAAHDGRTGVGWLERNEVVTRTVRE